MSYSYSCVVITFFQVPVLSSHFHTRLSVIMPFNSDTVLTDGYWWRSFSTGEHLFSDSQPSEKLGEFGGQRTRRKFTRCWNIHSAVRTSWHFYELRLLCHTNYRITTAECSIRQRQLNITRYRAISAKEPVELKIGVDVWLLWWTKSKPGDVVNFKKSCFRSTENISTCSIHSVYTSHYPESPEVVLDSAMLNTTGYISGTRVQFSNKRNKIGRRGCESN